MSEEKLDSEGHLLVDLELDPEGVEEELEIGLLEDPKVFDLGFSSSLPDSILLYFHSPSGKGKPHIMAFKGAAADKLLQTFYHILFTMGVVPGQEKTSDPFNPFVEPKKKITLH